MPGGRPVDLIWADFDRVFENGKFSHVACKLCNAKVSAKVVRMKGHMSKHQAETAETSISASTCAPRSSPATTESSLTAAIEDQDPDLVEVTQQPAKKVCLRFVIVYG